MILDGLKTCRGGRQALLEVAAAQAAAAAVVEKAKAAGGAAAILPLAVDPTLTLVELGVIEPERGGFHSSANVFPIGFTSVRRYEPPLAYAFRPPTHLKVKVRT